MPRRWAVAEDVPERRDSFLIRPLPPSVRSVAFIRVTRVYGETANGNSRTRRAPADVVSLVARHPALETTRPRRTRLGGRPATVVDAFVRLDARDPYQRCAAQRRCVFLFATESGPVYLFQGKRTRFHFLRVGGATVVITIEALSGDFDAFAPSAAGVVRSVRFARR